MTIKTKIQMVNDNEKDNQGELKKRKKESKPGQVIF